MSCFRNAGLDAYMRRAATRFAGKVEDLPKNAAAAAIARLYESLLRHSEAAIVAAMSCTAAELAPAPPTLADIARMAEALVAPPHPFNGATELLLSPALAEALAPHLRGVLGPSVKVSPSLPSGCGYGFRPQRADDAEDIRIDDGRSVVWVCAPKREETEA